MKKILIVTHSYELNTSYSKLTRNLYSLFKKEYDIKIFSTIHHQPTLKEPHNYVVSPDKNKLYEGFIQTINHFQPDIVFTFGDIWTLEFVYQAKIRHSFRWLAYLPVEGKDIPKIYRINDGQALDLQVMLDTIDYKVAYSQFGKTELEKLTDIDTYIYHGVDTNIFQPLKIDRDEFFRSNGSYTNPKTFLFIGDNQLRKGIDLLIEAWEKYIKVCPNSLLILYTQKISQWGWDLSKLITEKKLDKSILFIEGYNKTQGKTDNELAYLYNVADCYISAARAEGFGMPILEAMSCGIPVIAPNFATPAEYCDMAIVNINKYCNLGKFGTQQTWCEVDTDRMAYFMQKINKSDGQGLTEKARQLDWKNLKHQWQKAFKECLQKKNKIGGIV